MVVSPLFDIGIIILVATFFAYIARTLKQPLLVAYVLAGILIGPIGLGLIKDTAEITMLAELGIAFLLFTVGLEMDVQKLRSVGVASAVGGIIQVVITFFIGFFLASYLGFGSLPSIYFGLLLAFSSTMIVTKLLVDKNEINTLHGRIMLGILLVQDILVIIALPLLENIYSVLSLELFGMIIVKGLGLFSIAVVLNRFAFRRILDYAAESYEILFLTAVATCFFFIGLSFALGFSIAIGAFIGGIALASFPYNLEIEGEIHSLRDFFAVIFFTTLGMQLNLNIIYVMFPYFVILLLLILFAKPIILSLIYLFRGYGGRASSIIGLGLGQASEFSFIIAAQGLVLQHISEDIYSLIVSIVVISIVFTPYFMLGRNRFYEFFSKIKISILRKYTHPEKLHKIERHPEKELENHTVVFGSDRMGDKIVDYLKNKEQNFVVVEHNPEVVKRLSEKGVYCVYGDAENDDVLRKVGMYRSKLIIITIPNNETSCFVVKRAKRFNPRVKIFARAHSVIDAENLYKCGANFVVVPEFVSSERIVRRIEHFLRKGK